MSWEERVAAAQLRLAERTAAAVEQFRLGAWERFDYDLDVGTLVFSDDERARVVADIALAGTLASETESWLWGWANPWMPNAVKQGFEPLIAYGAEEGYARLTDTKWPATEGSAWEVASVAADVLDAQLVYRAPTETGALFLLLSGLRWIGE